MIVQIPSAEKIRSNHYIAALGDIYNNILNDVRSKELFGLGEPFIAYYLEHFLRIHPRVLQRLQEPKAIDSAAYKQVIKAIKEKARPVFGVFEQRSSKRQELLDAQDIHALLETHKSTQERVQYYDEIFTLFPRTTKSILDIGSGMHPLQFLSKKNNVAQYDTIEVSHQMSALYEHHMQDKVKQHTHYVTHFPIYFEEVIAQTNTYDVVCAFKIFDTLEQQKRHSTVKIIGLLKTKLLIASFSMKNIRGQHMERTQAGWFEKVVRQLEGTIEQKVMIHDELFYLVSLRKSD